ncbi:MAG: hypothetical protein ACI9FB_001744 [Candidatus Azotimanducaceae bacterium]|jgi:hypothetical protein
MIYRYRVYEEKILDHWLTHHSAGALQRMLEGFPQKLAFALDDAEVHNEIVDLNKSEAYLKITTDLDEDKVTSLVDHNIKISGLHGSRLV